jgi:hypothetical protein
MGTSPTLTGLAISLAFLATGAVIAAIAFRALLRAARRAK